jgi:hypothetical protein
MLPQGAGSGWLTLKQKKTPDGFWAWPGRNSLKPARAGCGQCRRTLRHAALSALAYECSLFSSEASNRPDLLAIDPVQTASGDALPLWSPSAIGLARLAALPFLDDAEIHGEMEAALHTATSRGLGEHRCSAMGLPATWRRSWWRARC